MSDSKAQEITEEKYLHKTSSSSKEQNNDTRGWGISCSVYTQWVCKCVACTRGLHIHNVAVHPHV